MNTTTKYTWLAIGVQILLCIIVVMIVNLSPGHDSTIGVIFFYFYSPVILVFAAFGSFIGIKGESAMIDPIMLGVPTGILIYGAIFGAIYSYFKKRKNTNLK